jgi:aminoglycoside phosphotransferase (APT) family kinase protein
LTLTVNTARDWVEDVLGEEVVHLEPLVGATSSNLYRVIPERGPAVVLRLFTNQDWLALEPDLAEHEAAALEMAYRSPVPTPELLAFDRTGSSAGAPAVLMSEVAGAVVVNPPDHGTWLDGLAETLATLHEIETAEFPWIYRLWQDLESVIPPAWAAAAGIWERAIDQVRALEPPTAASFIHRDFHPVNVLWSEDAVAGVVDWVNACCGPWQVDVAHCRLNLAAMYGIPTADDFGIRYEEMTGRSFDSAWDLRQVVEWLPAGEVYSPWLELGLVDLDTPTVRSRLEQFAAQALDRLG